MPITSARLHCARLFAALVLCLATGFAAAQSWPTRPITMVMPYSPGGPGDAITRVFAAAMQKTLGQQILVDNTAADPHQVCCAVRCA